MILKSHNEMQITLNREKCPPKHGLQLVKGRWALERGSHDPISHIVGEPGIFLYGLTKGQKRYLKAKRMLPLDPSAEEIITALNHESIHCALFKWFQFKDDGLDNVISDVARHRRLLGA